MEQTYENRGKVAFIEDQAAGAAQAFREGDFPRVIGILQVTNRFIAEWLAIEQQRGN